MKKTRSVRQYSVDISWDCMHHFRKSWVSHVCLLVKLTSLKGEREVFPGDSDAFTNQLLKKDIVAWILVFYIFIIMWILLIVRKRFQIFICKYFSMMKEGECCVTRGIVYYVKDRLFLIESSCLWAYRCYEHLSENIYCLHQCNK